jgi:hypothetical protein
MEDTNSDKSPNTIILNEVSLWLDQVDLKARPTSVNLDIGKSFCPASGELTYKFYIDVKQKFERIDEQEAAETPAKAAD